MIELLSISPLSSIQDLGRDGYLRYGVGTSGAMDDVALAVGNLLLGNPENSAAIEVQMFPYEVRFLEDTVFALSGADAAAELDGVAVASWWARRGQKEQVRILEPPGWWCGVRPARSFEAVSVGFRGAFCKRGIRFVPRHPAAIQPVFRIGQRRGLALSRPRSPCRLVMREMFWPARVPSCAFCRPPNTTAMRKRRWPRSGARTG